MLYWFLKNKPTLTPTTSTSTNVTNPSVTSVLPFETSQSQLVTNAQITPTPATVLSPAQLLAYNTTGSINTTSSTTDNSNCCSCRTLAGGINKDIFVC